MNVLKKTADVSIIGSGIIGNSIALSLVRKGFKVNVYDSGPAPGYGTTSYSSGICRMYYSLLDSVKFSWEGYHYWDSWEDHLANKDPNGYAKLNKCGALFLRSKNSDAFLDNSCKLMKKVGVPLSDLNFWETELHTQHLGMDIQNTYYPRHIEDPQFGYPDINNRITGSVFFPETGYVGDPLLATLNVYHAAKELGVNYHFNTKITEVNIHNLNGINKISGITTEHNEKIDCPIVINCGGPYSTHINTMAFLDNNIINDSNISCRPLRREVAYTQYDKGRYNIDKEGKIVIDLDSGLYFRPEVGNKILIGSTEPDCEPKVWEDDLDNMDTSNTDLWFNQMCRAALRIPELEIPNSKNQQYAVSTYDVSDDWTPIYDKSSIAGYYMAIGTSGNQFKNAPVAGEMMAELVEECENGLDHDNNPLIYKLKKTEGTINTKMFSRLRPVHSNDRNVFG
jgi:sarcosine oxidase, subunit beta